MPRLALNRPPGCMGCPTSSPTINDHSNFLRLVMKRFRVNLFNFLLGIGVLLYLSSCTFHTLDVQTQYLSHENLASYYVGTPDPHLDHPVIGQRLLVQWSLTSEEMAGGPLFLRFIVRFRNHQEKEIKVYIDKRRGYYVYDLVNQDYFESG